MVFVATALILLGAITAVLGLNLFRLLLPIVGLVVGIMVGFSGVQGIFGTGVVSTTIAIIIALIVGAAMALLSYLFFEIAVVILAAAVGAALLTYLGVALSLGDNGFVMLLLTIAGAVLGFVVASSGQLSTSLVIVFTSLFGVSLVLAGIFLLAGNISLDEIDQNGVFRTVANEVDSAFLWFIAWIGATLLAVNVQAKTAVLDTLDQRYAFTPPKKK